jgi:hypothetical protein
MVAELTRLLGPLWWMWVTSPFLAAFVYVLAAKDDPKRMREVERWRKTFGPLELDATGGYRDKPKTVATATTANPPPRTNALPGLLSRALRGFDGGEILGHYELVPKLAYLSLVGSNAEQASDFQAVVGKLESKKGPAFNVSPIPIVEGIAQPNTGIEFPKDREFTELFVVEAIVPEGDATTPAVMKAIRKWLSQPIRDALKDLPEVFVRVEGQTMVVAYYGEATVADLNRLILAADTLFAEHGGGGGPSLFGEAEDEDDDEDEEDVEEATVEPKGKAATKGA